MDDKDQLLVDPSEKTGPPVFVIGGVNSTETIRNLTEINGIPIAELEKNMRDGLSPEELAEDEEKYRKGQIKISKDDFYGGKFLGSHESLVDVLAEDNNTVLGFGLTHEQLADFLSFFRGKANGTCNLNGRNFEFRMVGKRLSQQSPFRDGTSGFDDYHLRRIDDDAELSFSGLLPDMIRRYGFYEGKGTSFRVDPREIAEIAGFVPKVG